MSPKRLNRWLTLSANVGVIVGIVFLALEIRQSNLIAIATAEISIRDGYSALNESIYGNAEFAEILFKARDADAQFSGVQVEMIDSYIARQMNTWNAIERAYNNGMVSESTLNVAKEDIKWAIDNYPSFRKHYQVNVDAYPSNEQSEVSRTIVRVLESNKP